jgi:hypothetical protein
MILVVTTFTAHTAAPEAHPNLTSSHATPFASLFNRHTVMMSVTLDQTA